MSNYAYRQGSLIASTTVINLSTAIGHVFCRARQHFDVLPVKSRKTRQVIASIHWHWNLKFLTVIVVKVVELWLAKLALVDNNNFISHCCFLTYNVYMNMEYGSTIRVNTIGYWSPH